MYAHNGLLIGKVVENMGLKPSDLKLKSGLFGTEPWSENIQREIEMKLRIIDFKIYDLSEMLDRCS